MRGRRERRRHVRPRDRAAGRRQRAGRADGPPVRDHPPAAAHPRGPADDARSRSPRVLPRGGRRHDRRWLRARPGPVVRRRRHPARPSTTRCSPPDWDRFLPLTEAAHDARALPGRRRGARSSSTARRRSRPTASSSSARARSPGFFVAAGFCAHGIAGAGGNGQGDGRVDRRRRAAGATSGRWTSAASATQYRSRGYCLARTYEVYSTYYDIVYPNHERRAGRPLRLPPAYARHVELGAEFGEKSGWERVNWYASNEDRGPRATSGRAAGPDSTGRRRSSPSTSPAARRPALFDESSFAKIEVDRARAPRRSSSACAPTTSTSAVGSITYTSMLNSPRRHRVRLHRDPARGRALPHRHRHGVRPPRPARGSGATSRAAPRRHGRRPRRHVGDGLLRPVGADGRATSSPTSADDDLGFRYLQRPAAHRRRRARASALRVTYVGELGWELYPPSEYGLRLWDTLMEAGRPYGLVPGGYRAIDSLRLEKGYRVWGVGHHERDRPRSRPVSASPCGSRRVPSSAGTPLRRSRRTADASAWPAWSSTTRARSRSATSRSRTARSSSDGSRRAASATRSASRSPTRGCPPSSRRPGTRLVVEVFGQSVGAEVRKDPLYDPKGERIRA